MHQTTNATSKDKTGATAENINSAKLKDVTNFMIEQLVPGEIMRFGEGWITICEKCKSVIILGPEFKTFSSKNQLWRIAPSIACPEEGCDWHVSAVVEPEETVEVEETEEAEKTQDDTETHVTVTNPGVKA